jgi:TctA family transporter
MTTAVWMQAIGMVFEPYVLMVILASAVFGLFVGCIPGLTATMATALLVPMTFFMPPVPAVAAIVTATAMAIFSGDIPGALLRIPGTPASAAYADEAYQMTLKGQAELALGAGLVFSVIGGLVGTLVLILFSPTLAEFALRFSSFEYFWLMILGLSGAIFIGSSSRLKAAVSLLLGLLIACIGLENPAAHPRFTLGLPELMSGIELIPMMVGMFAISELLRYVTNLDPPAVVLTEKIGNIFAGVWTLLVRYPWQLVRGSALGTLIGIQPGAGADMAAWMSYASSKKFSKEPEKFGTGHVEGIAIFIVFLLANLLLLPLGWLVVKLATRVLRVARNILMPTILLFCIVGAFAVTNSALGVLLILLFGLAAFVMEENGFPVAPAILGVVLGKMLEENLVTSMIKSDGDPLLFFTRPIAMWLAAATLLIALWSVISWWRQSRAAAT